MKFTFSKSERLCSRKLIDLLFLSGKSVTAFPFRIKYYLLPTTDAIPLQVLFSIPKKMFKRAVKRNLIRRRAKEVFRLNKHILYENIPENHKLILAFIYSDNKIHNFEVIEKEVIKGIKKTIKKIKSEVPELNETK